jgi:D-alanyl-D-alanine dipeptidase
MKDLGIYPDPGEPLVLATSGDNVLVVPIYHVRGIAGFSREVWLRAGTWERLRRAARALPASTTLVLLDGWRSEAMQRAAFAYVNARTPPGFDAGNYAFDATTTVGREFPTADAPHRTGGAVDVALLGPDGRAWPMGTDFDAVSEWTATWALHVAAERGDTRAPGGDAARAGRRTLHRAMTSAGFTNYPAEWWHYDWGSAFWRHFGGTAGPVYRTVERLRS